MTTTSSGISQSIPGLKTYVSRLIKSGHPTYYCTIGMLHTNTRAHTRRASNSTTSVLLSCSAHDKFDATFKTNVLVNSSGFCEYLPPGKMLLISVLS